MEIEPEGSSGIDGAVAESTDNFTSSQGDAQGDGGNPAWASILEALPSSLHSTVTPQLQEWDRGVNQRFQEIHQTYAPWKEYMDAGVDPQAVNYALQVLQQLEADPRSIYDSIGQHFGYTQDMQQQDTGQQETGPGIEDDFSDPRVAQLEEGFRTLASVLIEERQTQTQFQEDQQLDSIMVDLKTKNGDFDETFVLTQMLNGATPDQAIGAWNGVVESIRSGQNRPLAPNVMPAGGAVPAPVTNAKDLSDKDTRGLVAQMLQHAQQQP